jgi:hypothetical protein
MAENKVCAYIDILGFKEIINKDINGAIQLINDYQEILKIKKIDESMFKEKYEKEEKDMNLKSLFDKSIIDSFEYFIPFSDSAFIVANNAAKFVFQISNYLLGSFMLGGYIYDDRHSRDKDDLMQLNNSKRKWYPLLFRGGVSFGECIPYKNYQITGFQLTQNYNLMGKAVAEAVQNESTDKGPRLFCSKQFYDVISANECKQILCPLKNHKDIYEILWPMPYIARKKINGYQNLLEIGLNLWLYFNHMEYGIHYFRLLELIIKSIMETYKNNPSELSKGFDVISDKFSRKYVDITKIKHILDEYKS